MRKFYTIIIIIFIFSILLFITSFLYLDKEKHKTYNFIINLDGHDAGLIKVDKYITEDKRVYKSASETAFYPIFTSSKSRLDLDKMYNLETYSTENSGNGTTETYYIENKNTGAAFVSIANSRFAHLSNIPIASETYIFAEECPATYLPIIENYNFKKGRSQGFNSIIPFAQFLPPIKRFVTLTSTRDEYLTIDSKKIKAECLLLKIRGYPQATVWVAKSDKSLVMIEMPNKNLKITRTFYPKKIEAKDYSLKSEKYITKELSFKNKNVTLSGTLTTPKKEGKSPAIILIWDEGPQDREYQGIFTSLADGLAKEGYAVLRFDKRGVAASGGDANATTDDDEIADVASAVEFLRSQSEVDGQKIALIGHSKGSYYATRIAVTMPEAVKTAILMSPIDSVTLSQNSTLKEVSPKFSWTEEYLKLAIRANDETMDKINKSSHSWVYILRKKCFLDKMRKELAENPVDTAKKVTIPVLILQGKGDNSISIEASQNIEKAMEESGNLVHSLVYFGYLDHLLSKRINDGIHKIHYEFDDGALETIKNWLKKCFEEQPLEQTSSVSNPS